jgi:vacuolar-type H+-ATPase subunit I/STV1
MQKTLEETKKVANKKAALAESKDKEIAAINESIARNNTLNELLNPLAKDKARIMEDLLESVATPKLRLAFEKYLPAVMTGSASKTMLSESKTSFTSEVTGNRTVKVLENDDAKGNIVDIKRLAGLK